MTISGLSAEEESLLNTAPNYSYVFLFSLSTLLLSIFSGDQVVKKRILLIKMFATYFSKLPQKLKTNLENNRNILGKNSELVIITALLSEKITFFDLVNIINLFIDKINTSENRGSLKIIELGFDGTQIEDSQFRDAINNLIRSAGLENLTALEINEFIGALKNLSNAISSLLFQGAISKLDIIDIQNDNTKFLPINYKEPFLNGGFEERKIPNYLKKIEKF